MRIELFPFQVEAVRNLHGYVQSSQDEYQKTHDTQVISFTAPTGAGKTIIMASLIEDVLFGNEKYQGQENAIFVWLSDSPQLNEQSMDKIVTKSDRIQPRQCVMISDETFDQEVFDDGHIYFLNTQKLREGSNLVKHGDRRHFTIWETLENTIREKNDRLIFIIDEAHRGARERDVAQATSIMQKFIKGSPENGLSPMPVVIGMSATMGRFNELVQGAALTIRYCAVTVEDVRESGLLKNRIVITYPEEGATINDMAVLRAAADDWKDKCDRWERYCREQNYANVNPIFVIQVANSANERVSDTDLDECLRIVEEKTGFRFDTAEVVHTFGDTNATLIINGIDVRYEEPSRISDDPNVRVVLFKEALNTGWDCPRAETMMSFRRARDATYIAQLLGRMVRTPLQKHIEADDVLNDVRLFLPYFDQRTVEDVISKLQDTEGASIPADVYGESLNDRRYDTLTIYPNPVGHDGTVRAHYQADDNQINIGDFLNEESDAARQNNDVRLETVDDAHMNENTPVENQNRGTDHQIGRIEPDMLRHIGMEHNVIDHVIDREGIVRYINESGLLSYNIRRTRTSNYLVSLLNMAHLLTRYGLYVDAVEDVRSEIVEMIHKYVSDLRERGEYEDLAGRVRQVGLQARIYDVFGGVIENDQAVDLFTMADADIDRQFRTADKKLGNDGIGNAYGRRYGDFSDPGAYMTDVILFTLSDECIDKLYEFAEKRFNELIDKYRRRIAALNSEKINTEYDGIVSDSDQVSKHNFHLSETIQVPHDNNGLEYADHLFVEKNTGTAKINLNEWERGVLKEERKRDDFVCWIRNPARAYWSLTIPYEIDGEMKSTYPDLIIVRRDEALGYVIDVLEPHGSEFNDNLGKAKGFAQYASQNPGIGRIQLIRKEKVNGIERFVRLDMAKTEIHEHALRMTTQNELNDLFRDFGESY